jgi:hypothetical protein
MDFKSQVGITGKASGFPLNISSIHLLNKEAVYYVQVMYCPQPSETEMNEERSHLSGTPSLQNLNSVECFRKYHPDELD